MHTSQEILADLNVLVQHFAQQAEVINQDRRADTNATQAHILMLLDGHPLSNGELAAHMHLSKPAITKAIKLLMQAKFITGHPAADDRRRVVYQLTPSGQELALAHQDAHQQMVNQIQNTLANFDPDQQQTITQFLKQLNQDLGKDSL
ncbi:MarR family transcriptional regulator [Leuconostocaceae bacterium ESL0723]|nr:MarR family transcriptional regulator [Leuconostocaceae bacterium ESL0723]